MLLRFSRKKALASAFDIEVNDLDHQEKPITMKYEYKFLKFDLTSSHRMRAMVTMSPTTVDPSGIEALLNQHGAEGWELFHISDQAWKAMEATHP